MTDNAWYHNHWKDSSLQVASTRKVEISREVQDNVVVTGTIENYCLVSLTIERQGGGNLVPSPCDGSGTATSTEKAINDIMDAAVDVLHACADNISSEMFEDAV